MREPYQKVVKISPLDGKFMATGGEDGILRIWTFPDLNQVKDLEEHDKEIDDIEFSPDQTKVGIKVSQKVIIHFLNSCNLNVLEVNFS